MANGQETEIIAREYLALGQFKCRWALQRQMALATASGDWNEMRKWYRVQMCVRQLMQGKSCPSDREFSRRLAGSLATMPPLLDEPAPVEWI